jgi:YfiH family protein
MEFSFGSSGAPKAILSVLAAGNMKYDPSGVNPARMRLFSELGLEPSRIRSLQLRHTRNVIFQGNGEAVADLRQKADAMGGADGLVVAEPESIPALTVADCMPIWLFDPKKEVFGLLHSGWRGTGILKAAVLGMISRFGSAPDDISAILGPSIGACCYTVPEERAMSFAAEFGETSIRAAGAESGKDRVSFSIDLRAANIHLAGELGLGSLLDVKICTSCSPNLGSFRRQGAQDFTRMLALCGYF